MSFGGTAHVAWITGAGSGMGATHARRLAPRGMRVACIDIDGPAAERTAELVIQDGGQAMAIECDVADWQSVALAAGTMHRAMGPVGTVVANAGILGPIAEVADTDVDDWVRVIAVNLTGCSIR
jgi:NAD(P)-dependent dehydrogenase (short-subunit alcohol dehydrogenase family)